MKITDLSKIREIYEGGAILLSGLKNRKIEKRIMLMIF